MRESAKPVQVESKMTNMQYVHTYVHYTSKQFIQKNKNKLEVGDSQIPAPSYTYIYVYVITHVAHMAGLRTLTELVVIST